MPGVEDHGAVQQGRNALMYSTHRTFDANELERLDAFLDHVYDDFTGKVASGRSMSQDDVHARIGDLKSFEIYMLGIEAVCRDAVTAAMKIPDGGLDEAWAASVCGNIEAQFLQS